MPNTDDHSLDFLLPRKSGRKLYERRPAAEHEKFFKERGIPWTRLADHFGVKSTSIFGWFKYGIPTKWLPKITELEKRVLEWEEKNGRQFGQ